MIEIRPSRPEDLPGQKALWNAVFQEDPRCTDWFYESSYCPEDMILLLEDGKLATMMAVLPQTIRMPGGGTASTWYFFSLCTWPEFRGRGISRHMILYVSQMLKDRGADCAIGVPREASLFQHYRTMGRLPTFYTRFAEVPAEDVTSLVPGDLAQPVDPAGYNAIRERLLEGLPSVSYPTEQIRYQEGLCRLLGGGLFRVSVGDAEGCALVERDGAERVLIKELLLPPELMPRGLAALAAQVPCQQYQVRTPAQWDGFPGSEVRPFGDIRWFNKEKEAQWKRASLGYLGLAYD